MNRILFHQPKRPFNGRRQVGDQLPPSASLLDSDKLELFIHDAIDLQLKYEERLQLIRDQLSQNKRANDSGSKKSGVTVAEPTLCYSKEQMDMKWKEIVRGNQATSDVSLIVKKQNSYYFGVGTAYSYKVTR